VTHHRRRTIGCSWRCQSRWLQALFLLIPSTIATKEWQYFCFDSAAAFGRISSTTIFSVLPNPSGKPVPSPTPPPSGPEEQVKSPASVEDGPALSPVDRAARQLKGLDGTCYFMRVGYWTYEVCPWKTVRQYHTETGAAGGAAVHSEFSLGKYEPTKDSYQEAQNIYAQVYADGTEGRGSVVRFICPDSWRDEDGVVVVHEPKPKQYVITLRVQAMCSSAKRAAAAKNAPAESVKRRRLAKDATAEKGAKKEASKGGGPTAAKPEEPTGGPMQIAELGLPNTRLLASIRGRCFSMVRDYWTYEFCPMQHVRQYRQEGNRVGAEFNLGTYDRTLDKLTVGVRGTLDATLVPHTFAQTYNNGTGSRRAQVRVRCSTKNEHSLIGIDEPSTHEYVMIFSSPLGCEISCAYAFATVSDD